MRILHVVPTYVPAWRYGGPIVSVHGLCRSLASRGHHVEVYTTTVDGSRSLNVSVGTPVDVDGVHVTYFHCDGPRRIFWSQGLRRALKKCAGDFDLVHMHACYSMPPVWAARAARGSGVPYVFSPRGMLVPELIARRSAWMKRLWIELFEKRTVREAAFVHLTSSREVEDLRRVLPWVERYFVVANGVDLPPTQPSYVEPRGRRVLYLGRVNWKKGIDLAIRMMSRLPDARLRVVGNDEEGLGPELQKIAAVEGVASRIDWLGACYGEAKLAELMSADVFVMPSVSENFGNTILEAMAAGLPVVCSAGVGASELVSMARCGLVVERTPEAYSAAVAALLGDPERRAQMGESGRRMAQSFSWETKAAEMEQLYMEAVVKGKALADQVRT